MMVSDGAGCAAAAGAACNGVGAADAMGASWVEDPDFDLHRHVLHEKLARGKGQSARAALQARAGELATTPLDPERPLWQFHLIDDYEGGSALIARVHHCIGDGIALISVMMSITDGGNDPPQRRRRAAAEPQHQLVGIGEGFEHRRRRGLNAAGHGQTGLLHDQSSLFSSEGGNSSRVARRSRFSPQKRW